MTTTQAPPAERLAERYGRRRSPGRRLAGWIIVGALMAALVGLLAWTTLSSSAREVKADDLAMRVVDAQSVEVSFQVTGPRGAEYACALEALDEQFGVVGWKIVTIPASDETTRAFTEVVPTLAEAATGFVNACWVP